MQTEIFYRVERAKPATGQFEVVGNYGADRAAAVYHFKFYRSLGRRSATEYRLVESDGRDRVVVLS